MNNNNQIATLIKGILVCKYATQHTKIYKFWKDHRFGLSKSMENIATLIREYLGEERIATPNPEWIKLSDLQNLATRIRKEFDALIFVYNNNKYFALLPMGDIFDIATGEGIYEGYGKEYFTRLAGNLSHRLEFLSLRQSTHLSRETVKSYLYRPATKITNEGFATLFEKWLANSSWKSKYWMHHDVNYNHGRFSVIANRSKDMLIITKSDGIHIYSGKRHLVIKKLPKLFYKFAFCSLIQGKDYTVTGVNSPCYW